MDDCRCFVSEVVSDRQELILSGRKAFCYCLSTGSLQKGSELDNIEQQNGDPILECNESAAGTATSAPVEAGSALYRYGSFVIALLLIFAAVYCRIRLLDVPLERDEGGFAYIGQQMLDGIAPYHSGNMKIFPGIHVAYAAIMLVFGETTAGIHAGLLVVNVLSIIMLFFLARRMLPVEGAAVAAGSFALLSVSKSVLGVFAHATHFVNLFVLAGLLSLLCGVENKRIRYFFISGLCLGTSVMMKQHGVFFCLFAFCYVIGIDLMRGLQAGRLLQRLSVMAAGVGIPYSLTCLYMYLNGVFKEFWFWTVVRSINYAASEFSAESLSAIKYFVGEMSINLRVFWLAAFFGLMLVFFSGYQLRKRWFVVVLFFFSIVATLPSLSFYPHHFVVMLPSLALLIGVVFVVLPHIAGRILATDTATVAVLLLFLVITVSTLVNRFDYLFTLSPYHVSRSIYGINPFPESRAVGQFIKSNSSPATKIAVFGSEPQIYFYADRPSATDYLYMYPLVEQQPHAVQMQQEMIREIKKNSPEYIVTVNVPMSWIFDKTVGKPLLAWMEFYLVQYYQQVGVIELDESSDSKYYWNQAAEKHVPASTYYMLVYRRNQST